MSPQRLANIFINYRREDSAGHAGRLFDGLRSQFAGRLFMDIDNLEPGVDFVDAIEKALRACEVLLVVIGREWLSVTDKAGRRRLENPADYVRLELEAALERGIRVIPVLVQDTPMPAVEELPASLARLARRNAIELSDARWAYDVERLGRTIQAILDEKEAAGPGPAALQGPASAPADGKPEVAPKTAARTWMYTLAALLVAAALLVPFLWTRFRSSGTGGPSQQAGDAAIQSSAGSQPAAKPTPSTAGPGGLHPTPETPAPNAATPAVNHAVKDPVRVPRDIQAASQPREIKVLVAEPAKRASVVPPAETPAPAETLPPIHATITAPPAGDTVGSTVQVRGTIAGQGDRRIFLCIKQGDGKLYPRGEIFAKDGQWSIPLRSSKEKTFEIMVVSSSSKEADQELREQSNRDHGLAGLPPGASISSTPVLVKRQGKFSELFNPKRPDGSR